MMIRWMKAGILVASVTLGLMAPYANGALPSGQQTSEHPDVADQNFISALPVQGRANDKWSFRHTNYEAELLQRMFYPPSLFGPDGDLQ